MQNLKRTRRDLLLGVDPSFDTMGGAIWSPDLKKLHLYQGGLDNFFLWLQDNYEVDRIVAVVEDPSQDSPTFGAWETMKNKISGIVSSKPGERLVAWNEAKKHFNTSMKISQNVGENKRAAKRTITILEKMGVPIVTVKPSERRRVDNLKEGEKRLPIQCFTMPTKTSKSQFCDLTGYSGPSDNNARDAATLVYKQTINWALVKYAKQNKGEFFNEEITL